MLPITISGELRGMLELGRADHPFRDSDAAELADFARHLAAVLARLGSASLRPARSQRT
jgi:hypothetical protein